VREGVEIKPSDLADAYERNRGKYRVDEQVMVSHIVVKSDAAMTAEQKTAAEKKANDILARARKGEDFAALAQTMSEDSATASKGGLVGSRRVLRHGLGQCREILS